MLQGTVKRSSILDYQQEVLCPEIWYNDLLKPEVKQFIIASAGAFFQELGLQGYQVWLIEALIASSLATYFYKQDTDLDVKYVVDFDMLKQYNPYFASYDEAQLAEYLTDQSRESAWLTATIPGTMHALDAYFYPSEELEHLNLLKYDSLYVLSSDTWVKVPKKLLQGLSPTYILEIAKEKARPYLTRIVQDLTELKKDTLDFIVLRDYMKNLEDDDLSLLREEFSKSLDIINSDIEDIVQDKNLIKDLRKKEFTRRDLDSDLEKMMGSLNFSDGNLVFKVMQRYGYLRLLVEIARLFKDRQAQEEDAERIISILSPNQ